MSLLSRFKQPGPSGFGYASTADDVTRGLDLSSKTYLLTGCNSGLGLETLRVLSLRGGQVLAAARTVDKARQACAGADGLRGGHGWPAVRVAASNSWRSPGSEVCGDSQMPKNRRENSASGTSPTTRPAI